MIRKALLSTINSRRPQLGMEHAFKGILGAENVAIYDAMDRRRQRASDSAVVTEFVDLAVRHRPDWAWIQAHAIGSVTPEALIQMKAVLPECVITNFMGDLREDIPEPLAALCRASDLTLISNQGQLQKYLDVGASRVQFCPIAADWHEDILGEPDWEPPFRVPEVVFCGSNYRGSFPGTVEREEAATTLLGAGIDFGIVGKGWPDTFPMVGRCERHQQSSVYKRANIVLSINNYNDIRRYYSNRLWVALASGKPVVCRWVPGIEEDLNDGGNCLLYRTSDELVEAVKRLLDNPDERIRIGSAGRALVLSNHTWFQRVLHVMARVEQIQAEIIQDVSRGAGSA